MSRFRNYGLWVSLFSFIILMIESLGYSNILPSNYQELISNFLMLLVALGIINNPTNGKGYLDK